MIILKRGESYPIFFDIKQDGITLTPDMIQDLEIHIAEFFRKSYLGGGVFYSADRGRWYIFPTTMETSSFENGIFSVCAHIIYQNGETYIETAGRIMVSSCN